jgi:hypothetical protein
MRIAEPLVPAPTPNYIWNKEQLSQRWNDAITVSIYKKLDKADCNNY